MDLVVEHLGDIFLLLTLSFGFILVAYINADYIFGEDRDDDDDRF